MRIEISGNLTTSSRLLNVVTRCGIPKFASSTFKYFLSRSRHVFRNNGTSFQVVIPNWAAGTTGDTNGSATSDLWNFEWEKSDGTIIPITAPSLNVTPTVDLVSNSVALVHSKGDYGWLRVGMHNPTLLIYGGGIADNAGLGDGMVLSATPITYSSGDPIPLSAGAQDLFLPAAIIESTTEAAAWSSGDSIFANDTNYFAQSVAPYAGYCNSAQSGTQSTAMTPANSPRRYNIANSYYSIGFSNFGRNDLELGGVSGATLISRIQTHRSGFTIPVIQACLTPAASSSNGFIDTSHQTARSYIADQITYNNFVKTLPGYVDPNPILQFGTDSLIWNVPGLNLDDLHPSTAGVAALVAGQVIPQSRLRRL